MSHATSRSIVSVNFHLWKPCNLECQFCFATFPDLTGYLKPDEALRLVRMLREAGCDKITFAGGEPTLCPHLGPLLAECCRIGLTTSIVTNGFGVAKLVEKQASEIDWIGLSVDSSDEVAQAKLGRGKGDHIARSVELFDLCRAHGIRTKLNTVVTSLTWQEDMSAFVRRVQPERWKIFQVRPVDGQNDGKVEKLLITGEQFKAFVDRHAQLRNEGIGVVDEDNDAMAGSYVMIDPLGRFFDSASGRHVYSAPILDVGVEKALAQVTFEHEKLVARGGLYVWQSGPDKEGR